MGKVVDSCRLFSSGTHSDAFWVYISKCIWNAAPKAVFSCLMSLLQLYFTIINQQVPQQLKVSELTRIFFSLIPARKKIAEATFLSALNSDDMRSSFCQWQCFFEAFQGSSVFIFFYITKKTSLCRKHPLVFNARILIIN